MDDILSGNGKDFLILHYFVRVKFFLNIIFCITQTMLLNTGILDKRSSYRYFLRFSSLSNKEG